jgi:homogentisate 1,2-dioxygenase
MHRIRPSVVHTPYQFRDNNGHLRSTPFDELPPTNQLRWSPPAIPSVPTNFVRGLITIGGNGDASA